MTNGLIDRISRHSQALIESDYLLDQDHDCPLLVASYDLLSRLCVQLKRVTVVSPSSHDNSSVASGEMSENSSATTVIEPSSAQAHLLSLLGSTEAAGVVGALYAAIALPSSTSQRAGTSSTSPTPNQMAPSTASRNLAWRGLGLLRNVAELDLQKLQVCNRGLGLGKETSKND